jgi:2'-5' RNA ligase
MYSIASILNVDGQELWHELEKRCQINGIKRSDIPHFSWQTAESYDFDPLRLELANICQNERPFRFHTSGLGIFPGERKILFLIIAKDRELMEMHERIWENTILYAKQPNMLYSPDNWVPHISLNLNALDDNAYRCAIDELTARPLSYEFTVSQMGLLYLTFDKSGADKIYDLSVSTGNK